MIALFSYFQKNNFKVGGSARLLGETGGKIELNVEKNGHFPSAKAGNFSRLSLNHQNTLFYIFSNQIHPLKSQKAAKVKKLYFLDKFQTLPSFFTLFLFWG